METLLLIPPIAFLIYIILVVILNRIGRLLAGPSDPSLEKSGLYTGGELMPNKAGAPGYRPFFRAALFFAILHLGVLVVATGGLEPIKAIYLSGLILALIALVLG